LGAYISVVADESIISLTGIAGREPGVERLIKMLAQP
jgi:hypothetical protein